MIGFLIINYNDAPTTKTLLENIKDYKCLAKIVVVDNGSTDHSFEELKKCENEKIEIIRREDGREFGAGINFGLRYLESIGIQYSFVSNSDVVIYNEDSLKKIIDRRSQGTIMGPVIKEHSGYNKGWKVPTNMQLLLTSLPFIYRFFTSFNQYPDEYYKEDFLSVEAVSFCFFFVSIEKLKKVNFLDEHTHLYFEENITSCRLAKEGIYLCNDVEVFHNHSVTIDKNLNRLRKYKALSESKRYFAKTYNHAGIFTQFLLWIIEKITVGALWIRLLF